MSEQRVLGGIDSYSRLPRAPDWTPLLSDAVRSTLGNGNCFTYETLLAEIAVQLKRIADAMEKKS